MTLQNEQKEMIRNEAESLMKEIVLEKKFPADRIHKVYNRIFQTNESPSTCTSCAEQKVVRIKNWLKGNLQPNENMLQIRDALSRRLLKMADSLPAGLYKGKMGLCIYLFDKARISGDYKWEKNAFDLLNKIIEEMKKSASLDFENGVTGIGFALDYLIKNGYIANDVNTMLTNIDSWIIARMNKKGFRADSALLLHLAYYFAMRLKDQKQGSDEEFIFREIVIGLVNDLHTGKHVIHCLRNHYRFR